MKVNITLFSAHVKNHMPHAQDVPIKSAALKNA